MVSSPTKKAAVVGSGPAALMAADVLSQAKIQVSLFEKYPGPARKLFIAGSSGLNVTHSLNAAKFSAAYGAPAGFWQALLDEFSPQDWLKFLENKLELTTFKGTSGRYFVKPMNASKLVRQWKKRLTDQGVNWFFGHELKDFQITSGGQVKLDFTNGESEQFDCACLALGGASYEPQETPLRWPKIFTDKKLDFLPFVPANVGYCIPWPKPFLKEAEGKALKNIVLKSQKGSCKGDIVITAYGVEGTPVYTVGEPGTAFLDLKPDLSLNEILTKCARSKENLSPIRRVKRNLNLSEAALALVFHLSPAKALKDINNLCQLLKALPLEFSRAQPISEAISSAGGLSLKELNPQLMLKKFPGVFVAGEMLNWSAPTGGFLIQGAVSQGYTAGHGARAFLA